MKDLIRVTTWIPANIVEEIERDAEELQYDSVSAMIRRILIDHYHITTTCRSED